MAANGLIVAFVVALWAAYFVPLVLRRYDEASKTSSLESLSSLSRIITRRTRDHDVEEAATESQATPTPAPAPADAPALSRPAITRASARIAAQRRRRTLITLLSALTLVAALVGFKVVAPVWLAVPATLVVAWLVACRIQVRGELGLSRPTQKPIARPAAKVATVTRVDPADEETIVVSGQFEEVDPGRTHVMEDAPLEADALDEQIVIAVPSVSTTGEALWDPLPVTVPTYVTKPRVGRTVRTIDFTAAGAWTSGHVEGEDVELPGQKQSEGSGRSDDQRRASGQ